MVKSAPPNGETREAAADSAQQGASALDGATKESRLVDTGEPPPAVVEPAMVDRGLQAQLGQQLRALFDDIASEPVPDRLLKLLDELAGKEKKR